MLKFADPALGDLSNGHWIDEMKPLSSISSPGDEVAFFENSQMFGYGLPGHAEAVAKFAESLPISLAQPIEKLAAAAIGEGLEDCVVIHFIGNHLVP